MRTPARILADILSKLPKRRQYSHGEDVFLIDKQGRVREHRQSLSTVSSTEVVKRQRRMRIIQP